MRGPDRLLRPLQLMRVRAPPITAERLAVERGVSIRSICRDIDLLRLSGARIEGERGYGLRLIEDYALPPQTFDRLEIEAIAVGPSDVRQMPDRVVIDKSGANLAGLQAVNVILKLTGAGQIITDRQVRYLNNILEQDHRFIKRMTSPMMGFKAVHSAAATLALIETAHRTRKGQLGGTHFTAFQQFAALAA